MTNQRRHDKESSAGGHRKRTKFRVMCPREIICQVGMALANGKIQDSGTFAGILFQHELKI